MTSETVHFKTNVQLKNIIGKDLITDDNIAVLELVKNAYDAGAGKVDIAFRNLVKDERVWQPEQNAQLLICDDGSGMDRDGILNRWLNIAYSEKKEKTWNYGRRQAGNKGVGRFSCDRLGKRLTIYTKSAGFPWLQLNIDWTLFELDTKQDDEIQDIPVILQEASEETVCNLTGWDNFQHGTVLHICELRENWPIPKILRLKNDLEKFINPNSSFQIGTFAINIKASDYMDYDIKQIHQKDKVNGLVENQIFNELNFRTSTIESYIDEEGKVIKTSLYDRGRMVFTLEEQNTYMHLRNVKIKLYYLNTYTKAYFTKQTGFRSVDFGSVFLFVNGFRIPPYGDLGDDWLGIEKRKSSGYRRYLSTREIIGQIEIEDTLGQFQVVTSRAGIVRSVAFEELSHEGMPYGYFYKTFRRLERFVVEGIKWDKAGDIPSDELGGCETYQLDDLSRNKQILSVIRKIIDVPDSTINNLHINEELVQYIIEKQMENSKQKLNDLLIQMADITDAVGTEKLRTQLDEDSRELDTIIEIINAIAPAPERLRQIEGVKDFIDKAQRKVNAKEQQLLAEKKAREKAEAKAIALAQELEKEKDKNTYLLSSSRSMSEDAKGMVHHIKLIATTLEAKIYNLYDSVKRGEASQEEILEALGAMKFQNDKSLKISKLITRANFRADKEDKMVDLMEYIRQYLGIYEDIVDDSSISFDIDGEDVHLYRKVSTLSIAVVLDNMISNAIKSHATAFKIKASLIGNNSMVIFLSDDGDGLDRRFLSNPDSIFELGVTSTEGSGIGLHIVRTILREMHAEISFAGNGVDLKGASFKITFK